MRTESLAWPTDSICLHPSSLDAHTIAVDAYERTCRTGFNAPGFCVINVGTSIRSIEFRRLMVDVKHEISALHASRMHDSLIYVSAARFDQQESTKPHLDGGPDECFLMLGYEPSEIASELEIFDYAKCAFDLGLTPKDFMAQHNPMFRSGHDLLRPYATRVPCFASSDYRIVFINNSSAPYSADGSTWQGVLHTATILNPDQSKRRIINSTMIARALPGADEPIDATALQDFVHTTEVRRRGYDKLDLEDDP